MLPFNSYEAVGEATVQGKEGDPGLINMPTGYRADFKFGEYDPASDSIAVKDLQIAKLTGAQKDQLTSLLKTTLNLTIGQTYILGAVEGSAKPARADDRPRRSTVERRFPPTHRGAANSPSAAPHFLCLVRHST